MKWPTSLVALVDYGIVDEVLRPLMSGKEAQVYLVRCGEEERVAKVYKEAEGRSFRQRADYTEGRRTRNTRDQRAVDKRTRHGKAQDEAAWRVAEVDRIRRLRDAGVRVPEPYEFVDGVLVMELVKDAEGQPAPRLGDLSFSADEAGEIYDRLISETVKMLAADIVHGDLSEFNVLMGADGPVIIDFPQAVDPTSNRNARTLLLRDVQNLHRFLTRFAPGRKVRRFGEEMWKLYEEGKLKADTVMRGTYKVASGPTDTGAVMALIEDAKRDAIRESGRGRRNLEDDSELEGESEYTVAGSTGSQNEKGPALRRVVDFTKGKSKSKPKAGGHRSRAGARTGESRDRHRAGSAREGGSDRPNQGRSQRNRQREHGGAHEARGAGKQERSGDRRDRNAGAAGEARNEPRQERSAGRGRGSRRAGASRGRQEGAETQSGRSRDAGQRTRHGDAAKNEARPDARRGRGSESTGSRTGGRLSESGGNQGAEASGRRRRGRGRSGGQGGSSALAGGGQAAAKPHKGQPHSQRRRGEEGKPAPNPEGGGPRKRSRRRRRRPSSGGGGEPS